MKIHTKQLNKDERWKGERLVPTILTTKQQKILYSSVEPIEWKFTTLWSSHSRPTPLPQPTMYFLDHSSILEVSSTRKRSISYAESLAFPGWKSNRQPDRFSIGSVSRNGNRLPGFAIVGLNQERPGIAGESGFGWEQWETDRESWAECIPPSMFPCSARAFRSINPAPGVSCSAFPCEKAPFCERWHERASHGAHPAALFAARSHQMMGLDATSL